MKRLGSHNILSGPASFEVPAGQYGAFFLRITGTNQAGQTLTLANCGNIQVTVGGHSFGYASYAAMNGIPDLMKGLVESNTVAAGAFNHTAILSASYVGDGNVYDIARNDNVYIDVDLNGVTAAIVANGTIELHGVLQIGAQAYWPKISQLNRTIAVSSVDVHEIRQDNVGLMFISGLTNISQFKIERDSQTVVDATTAQLLAQSNWYWNPTAALTDAVLLDFVQSGTFDESLSDKFVITTNTGAGGAGAPLFVVITMDPTPVTLDRSRQTYKATVDGKVERKRAFGRSRAVAVVHKLGMPIASK